MELLQHVQMGSTVWSIVYDMAEREIDICLDRNFEMVHTFKLEP